MSNQIQKIPRPSVAPLLQGTPFSKGGSSNDCAIVGRASSKKRLFSNYLAVQMVIRPLEKGVPRSEARGGGFFGSAV